MFSQFSEQMKNSSQPASKLLAANVKAMEAMTKQQTQFFSGWVDDSVKLMQTIAQQTEMKDVLAAQAVYAESLRERITSTSEVTYKTINSVSQQFTDALKSGFETASEATKETIKTAPTKKTSVKPLSASTDKSIAAKPASKAMAKKPNEKFAIKEQREPKSVAKPVAVIGTEEVKAPTETKKTDITAVHDNKSTPETKA
jgi:phasin family protein